MARSVALGGMVAGALAIAAAYASAFLPGGAPGWAAWAVALGTAAVMTCALMLGAARDGRPWGLLLPTVFAAVFVVLAGGFGLALLAGNPSDAAAPLFLGLPRATAAILYGVGLLPVLVVPVAYAVTFDARALGAADLEALRETAAAARAGGQSGGPGEGG